jgi:predicted acyl esterase
MTKLRVSGIEPGQRRLNGPQTTGRVYRNLSQPTHAITRDDDVVVPMRDGINLPADVHRPAKPGRYPVHLALLYFSAGRSKRCRSARRCASVFRLCRAPGALKRVTKYGYISLRTTKARTSRPF